MSFFASWFYVGYTFDFKVQVFHQWSGGLDGLFALMKSGGIKMKAVPLRLGASFDDAKVDRKWKVVVNQEIEIDDL